MRAFVRYSTAHKQFTRNFSFTLLYGLFWSQHADYTHIIVCVRA